MSQKVKVCVVFGGQSTEHEVSCRSAAFVFKHLPAHKYEKVAVAITKDGRWLPQTILPEWTDPGVQSITIQDNGGISYIMEDLGPKAMLKRLFGLEDSQTLSAGKYVIFPMLHGTFGEDGTFQGLAEMAEVAMVGSNTLGSAIAMNKSVAKELASSHGIKVGPYHWFNRSEWERKFNEIESMILKDLKFPLFVKPCSLGSSVGITKVKGQDKLRNAIETAFQFDTEVIVEQGISARELECAVLEDMSGLHASGVAEIIPMQAEFYTYEAKYQDDSGAKLETCANIDSSLVERIQKASLLIFKACRLNGMARIDFFYEQQTDTLYFNEANTIPGFTSISQYPVLWQLAGVGGEELCDRLVQLACARGIEKSKLKRNWL